MLSFFDIAAVSLLWVVFIALVKRDQGWVGITDAKRAMLRLRVGFHLMSLAFAGVLPIVRKMAKAMGEFNEAMERARG